MVRLVRVQAEEDQLVGAAFCLRRTYDRDPLYGLLLTFGAALVIEELIRVVWGSA